MFVGNALIAKARAIYGHSLRAADYELLLKKKSVPEIVSYLKTHSGYREILGNVIDESIHRAQLEEMIRKNCFSRIQKVVGFVKLKDEDFYEINVVHREHQIILSLIRSFISYEEQDIISTLPLFFDKYSKLNFEDLVKSTTIETLIQALGDMPYSKLLKPFAKVKNEDIKYAEIESVFENDYYQYAKQKVQKNYKGKLQKELLDVFETRIEISNIIKIYRLKKFYKADKEFIRSILIPSYTRLSQKKINDILDIQDPNLILRYIASSDIATFVGVKDQVYLEYFADYIKYDLAKKNIYYSTHPAKVFLGFMVLLETEVDNLTHIIEGIRYRVSEREIRQILVY
jgi:V/A-type H+-transporting ATPase subunit C